MRLPLHRYTPVYVQASDGLPLLSASGWLAVLLVSYVFHFAEEYWCAGGYPAYLKRLRGIEFSARRFVALQILGFVLLTSGALLSVWLGFPQLMLVIFSALITTNGLTHTATAVWDRRYGPGLIMSLIWLPVGIALLTMLYGHMSIFRYMLGVSIGIGIQMVIAIGTLKTKG